MTLGIIAHFSNTELSCPTNSPVLPPPNTKRPVIEQALASLGVETRAGISVARIDAAGATLDP
jgi:hypothetical protein